MFANLNEAAQALLLTTCQALNSTGLEYAIVGGWVPVIRQGAKGLIHPGTRDVDVLLRGPDSKPARQAVQRLLDCNFLISAKHEFQLLRVIEVHERNFVFNVDLMHPAEWREGAELFADVFDLGVPDAHDASGRRWVKSIVFQSAKIVFDRHLWSRVTRSGVGIEGSSATVDIPLLNEPAFIMSKLNSVKQAKRPRDAFDIYYVLSGPSGQSAANYIRHISLEIEELEVQRLEFLEWLKGKSQVFNSNVAKFMGSQQVDAASFVSRLLSR